MSSVQVGSQEFVRNNWKQVWRRRSILVSRNCISWKSAYTSVSMFLPESPPNAGKTSKQKILSACLPQSCCLKPDKYFSVYTFMGVLKTALMCHPHTYKNKKPTWWKHKWQASASHYFVFFIKIAICFDTCLVQNWPVVQCHDVLITVKL